MTIRSVKRMRSAPVPPVRRLTTALCVVLGAAALGGCFNKTYTHGYVVSKETLEQVPIGSSKEQVLLTLGSPSAQGRAGGEAFYYISQTREQDFAFMKPEIVDQRVLAVYFNDEARVREIANYGLQDGQVFDFISRRTRTGGADYGFLTQVLRGAGRINPAALNNNNSPGGI